MNRRVAVALCLSVSTLMPIGCASHGPQQLSGEMFMPAASSSAAAPVGKDPVASDPPAPATVPVMATDIAPLVLPPTTLPTSEPSPPLVALSHDTATTQPVATQVPSTEPAGSGYMTLGAVVAEVNGTPIYANSLLALVDREFAAKAKEKNADEFRVFARYELNAARRQLISDEVQFAAADRGLSPDDKKLIGMVMMQYMQQKITEAGGSIEVARQKSLVDGMTFEEMLHKHNREITNDLYIQHHVLPRIQVSVDDMRAFYSANVAKLYSEKSEAKFRVLKIDPARLGGSDPKAAALNRIRQIRDKAVRGDDFAGLASAENDDDYLKARGGDPGGWIERDAYRIDAIDKAVWKIEPGQVTEPIEDGGAFYIAKLEDRKIGRTRPFDDETVQTDIMNRLRTQQFSVIRYQLDESLRSESVVRGESDESLLDPAVDIAMQKYPQWAPR